MTKKITLLFTITLIAILSFSTFVNTNNIQYNDTIIENNNLANNNIILPEVNLIADDYVVTMRDIADFLLDKKEHYPFSDEFVERYQQTSGGYIENARKAGLTVDKHQHEPNQKWHFFESWLYPTIEEGGMTWESSAKDRVYTKLLCPELLLWIYEACEVNPIKVKAAKEIAEQGKVAGTAVTSIAKNMRGCVAWTDLEPAILEFLQNAPDRPFYAVSINQSEEFTVNNLKAEYRENAEVSFSITIKDKTKQIDTVKANGQVITPTNGASYKFTMPAETVSIIVTLKDKPVEDTPTTPAGDTYYTIIYDMGTRKTSKLLESAEDIFNTFTYTGDKTSIITSVTDFDKIYGGGYGSGNNAWVQGNMLKFGTTSVNGTLTLNLSGSVNCVKITGYIGASTGKIRVGDSTSSDWIDGATADNLTTLYECSEMNVASKDTVEANQLVTITIYFESTNSLRIATTNKKPLYITAIEFLNSNEN